MWVTDIMKSLWQFVLDLIESVMQKWYPNPVEPVPNNTPVKLNMYSPDVPATPKARLLEPFAEEIKNMEGWTPGSSSERRCNPGNLRCPPLNALAVGCDNGFCLFRNEADGMQGLVNVTKAQAKGQSEAYSQYARKLGLKDSGELNLYQYFAFRDPPADENDPNALAERFGKKFNVDPSKFQMKSLL